MNAVITLSAAPALIHRPPIATLPRTKGERPDVREREYGSSVVARVLGRVSACAVRYMRVLGRASCNREREWVCLEWPCVRDLSSHGRPWDLPHEAVCA